MSDTIERIGSQVVSVIQYARSILEQRGYDVDVTDSLDLEGVFGRFDVCVSSVPVYSVRMDFSGAVVSHVVGRWDLDALRALGMGEDADRIEAAHTEGRS